MKICMVHNEYGGFSGEEAVVFAQIKLLEEYGHEVCIFSRSSAEIPRMFLGQLRAFSSGIFNPFSRHAFKEFLNVERPDIVHVHNLFPLVSPSILPIANKMGFPVVMTVHNYRLVCPNGLHYSHGEVCTRCSGGREYWCAWRNCEGSLVKSVGYALRAWWARKRRYYLDGISMFACLTSFQKDILIQAGISAQKIRIIPNMATSDAEVSAVNEGNYVGFCGRLSVEKGIDVLVDVALRNRNIQFVAAGNFDSMPNLNKRVPENFTLLGHCNAEQMRQFYENAGLLVLPSVCFEGFPMVLLDAMLMKKAVICSDIGGLPDIVDDGVTGCLVRPSDVDDLSDTIVKLWERPELRRKMGEAGQHKALREYSKEQYYQRILDVYESASQLCRV